MSAGRGWKIHNAYEAELGASIYEDVPKAVLAAIAVSALTVGGDRLEIAKERLITEWHLLHENGIVPQPVPAKHRGLIMDFEAENLDKAEEAK